MDVTCLGPFDFPILPSFCSCWFSQEGLFMSDTWFFNWSFFVILSLESKLRRSYRRVFVVFFDIFEIISLDEDFAKDLQTSLSLWSKLSPFTHFVSMIDFKVGSCQCGVKKSRRIIGGSETEVLQIIQNKTICRLWQTIRAKWIFFFQNYTQVNEYPWMIVFANKTAEKQGDCGATLVSSLFLHYSNW